MALRGRRRFRQREGRASVSGREAAAAAAAEKIILFSRGKSEETHFGNLMFFGRCFLCELIHSRFRK